MSKSMKENLIALALILGSLIGLAYCPDAEATVYFTTEELDQMEANHNAQERRYQQMLKADDNLNKVYAKYDRVEYTCVDLAVLQSRGEFMNLRCANNTIMTIEEYKGYETQQAVKRWAKKVTQLPSWYTVSEHLTKWIGVYAVLMMLGYLCYCERRKTIKTNKE